MRAPRVAAAAAIAALALAACGSSGGKSVLGGSAATAAKGAATSPVTNSSASTAASDSSATSASGATTTVPKFSGSGSGDICSYAKQLAGSNFGSEFAPRSTNLKDTFSKLDDVLQKLQDKAPSEIKADLNTVVTGVKKIEPIYAKYDWDLAKLADAITKDPAAFADVTSTFKDPNFVAASERVTAYFSKVCGISSGEGETSTTG